MAPTVMSQPSEYINSVSENFSKTGTIKKE